MMAARGVGKSQISLLPQPRGPSRGDNFIVANPPQYHAALTKNGPAWQSILMIDDVN